MKNTVVLTGATGYIGSHMFVELLNQGFDVIGLDDLSNSNIAVLTQIEKICRVKPNFEIIDIRNTDALIKLFKNVKPDSVLHFAGVKSVKESVENPHKYYDINVGGSISLLTAMRRSSVLKLVFSSSATVYGEPDSVPVDETATLQPLNAYGQSKLFVERIIADIASADADFSALSLRYFNPIGAHASGFIGEAPNKIPDNLLPYVVEVASGKRSELTVFGDDYDTIDGTCIRDYIHVVDLVRGHLDALRRLDDINGADAINLGTGTGYSVLDVVNTFSDATGVPIPCSIASRRPGDAATILADPSKAERLLDWRASLSLRDMCVDHWRWGQYLAEAAEFSYS